MSPRQLSARAVTHEVNLSRRIAYEREKRGWTYEALARHMSRAGCPVPASALFKIEKGDPPRRINVDEFMTVARVFRIDPIELLRHPDELENEALRSAMEELRDAERKAGPSIVLLETKLDIAFEELDRHTDNRSAATPALEDLAARVPLLFSRVREWMETQQVGSETESRGSSNGAAERRG